MARDLDVAVLDADLNGEPSYPVAEALHGRGVPFLFAAGYGVIGLPEGLRGAPVLMKPFRREQLAAALSRAIGSG